MNRVSSARIAREEGGRAAALPRSRGVILPPRVRARSRGLSTGARGGRARGRVSGKHPANREDRERATEDVRRWVSSSGRYAPQPLPELPRVLESARGHLEVHAGHDLERGKRRERLGRARHGASPGRIRHCRPGDARASAPTRRACLDHPGFACSLAGGRCAPLAPARPSDPLSDAHGSMARREPRRRVSSNLECVTEDTLIPSSRLAWPTARLDFSGRDRSRFLSEKKNQNLLSKPRVSHRSSRAGRARDDKRSDLTEENATSALQRAIPRAPPTQPISGSPWPRARARPSS